MSTYGPPGPADPWNDETVNQDATQPVDQPPARAPVEPPASHSGGAPAAQPISPVPPVQSAPPFPQSAPPVQQPMPQSAPYQPGYAAPGYQPQQYAAAPYQPPAHGQAPYQQQYEQPKKSSAVLIVLLILLAVVVLAGAGVGVYLWRTSDATQAPPAVPIVNECLGSDGASINPSLTKIACGPGTYKVLKIQRGTLDTTLCNGVQGVTDSYTFQWPVDPGINDYVLCLQLQDQ